MPVESGSTISKFVKNWPTSNDNILDGDDHIRLIKSILQSQFPGASGNGFDSVIGATEIEINYLSGVTSGVQDQLNSLGTSVSQAQSDADTAQATADQKADLSYVDGELDKKAANVSTDVVFGGFKHTFSGGILNLITV